MTLGQVDLSIILGRSQNQALDIMRTDALINRDENFQEFSGDKCKVYNDLVEELFKLNKEQHERLININIKKETIGVESSNGCGQPLSTPISNLNIKLPKSGIKDIEDIKTQKQPSPKQKMCPTCGELINVLWKVHYKRNDGNKCGWGQ